MVEAIARGPGRESGFAELGETLLEAVEDSAGVGIARRDRAAGAGVAALEVDFADGEADDAAFVFAEELILPEGGDAVDFERGAETEADVVKREAGEPLGDGPEGSGGDDGGAVGDGVVRKAAGGITDDDLLLKENAEPFGGVIAGLGEGEGTRREFAAVSGDGEGDGAEVRGVGGADVMDEGSALAVDPLAVNGIEGPSTVEGEATGRGDAGLGDGHGIEGFDGVETDVGEYGSGGGGVHGEILTEGAKIEELLEISLDMK